MPFPNEETQFKPGQSGNPKGPKPGYKWMSTRLKELLEANNAEGRDKMLKALLEQGFKGNVLAIKEALDRIDGKVTQEVEQKTELTATINWEKPKYIDDEDSPPTGNEGNAGEP